jgi:hypothetical protein
VERDRGLGEEREKFCSAMKGQVLGDEGYCVVHEKSAPNLMPQYTVPAKKV